jgi:hypothetical protein
MERVSRTADGARIERVERVSEQPMGTANIEP